MLVELLVICWVIVMEKIDAVERVRKTETVDRVEQKYLIQEINVYMRSLVRYTDQQVVSASGCPQKPAYLRCSSVYLTHLNQSNVRNGSVVSQ